MFIRTARALLAVTAVALFAAAIPPQAKQYGFRIRHAFPHDPSAFVQGLEYRGGFLYEGTGLFNKSTLRKENLETGEVIQAISLPAQFFGEGITVIHQRIIQLTWQSHAGFVYDQASFKQIGAFTYPGEGWGLANDGQVIYMSDGTSQIRCLDPNTLEEKRRFTVHDGNQEIDLLNELECVRNEVFANVWHSNRIARILPKDGSVTGWIDLTSLAAAAGTGQNDEAVLNGIAYDAMADRLFVTGKLWPRIYEIRIDPHPLH